MVFKPKFCRLFLLLAVLPLTSCESKISQCQRIIKVHNQVVLETQKLTNSGTKGDTNVVLKTAEVFVKGATEMGAIEISDEKLTVLKTQFATMYQNSGQVAKQILDSQAKKKNSEVASGLSKLSQVASPEKNLVETINGYCGGSATPVEMTPPSSSQGSSSSPSASPTNSGNR
jgi:hypothetical protein